MAWSCPDCAASNDPRYRICEACGALRPSAAPLPTPSPGPDPSEPRRLDRSEGTCYTDGSALDREGRCLRTGLFAIARTRTRWVNAQADRYSTQFDKSPFACPTCRELITWAGTCYPCRLFPGDRYDIEHGHYVMTEKGPFRRATEEEAKAAAAQIALVMERARAEGKFVAKGDAVHVGELLLHGAFPGLRVGEKPEVIPAPPLDAA